MLHWLDYFSYTIAYFFQDVRFHASSVQIKLTKKSLYVIRLWSKWTSYAKISYSHFASTILNLLTIWPWHSGMTAWYRPQIVVVLPPPPIVFLHSFLALLLFFWENIAINCTLELCVFWVIYRTPKNKSSNGLIWSAVSLFEPFISYMNF